jgi:eukaryotic-like serine/threonine-protein kinase
MTDLRAQLQAGLGSSYTLERELGRGGMATVYLARDLKHDRPVALKVLHPELANTLGPERFQREIQLAARLQHPHILTVLDSGAAEVAGAQRLWFTMPFVEGESLRDRLQRERQLPIETACRVAREAAHALQYAHRHGVVHRDIKPENILLTTDGDTLVADFGIARALSANPDDARLTETGLTLGTPAYMSPEQASGGRELDARTDIYSLGAVLYEMLAGEPPFSGATPQALLARRVLEDAPPLRRLRPSAGEALERTVAKALARTPADRFETAGDFARALEASEHAQAATSATTASSTVPSATTATATTTTAAPADPATRHRGPRVPAALAFVLGLLVTASMGMLVWRQTHRPAPAGADGSRVVAVMPFENLGGPDQEYFADGVTDAIRGKLAAIPGLQVIARSSTSGYKGSGKSPGQIADELGAQYLLTGTVRWERGANGDRVQVSPELVQIRSGGAPTTQWQQPFSAGMTDVFQVQADIARQVAEALNLQLGEAQRAQIGERPTSNLDAYDAYLRGEELLSSGGVAGFHNAAAAYERAVALDTGFMQAWAQLSRANSLAYGNASVNAQTAERAREAAQRAVALGPGRFEPLLAMGDYYSYVPVDNTKALEQYALAQRLAPNNAEILSGAALSELSLGRWDESLAHLTQAQALDPRSVRAANRLARTLLFMRRYPEALAATDRAIALAPANTTPFEYKLMIHLAQGDVAGARGLLASPPPQLDPTDLVATVAQFWDLFWVLNDSQQQLLLRLSPAAFGDSRQGWALALAGTYALRGDQARARAYADSARIALEADLSKQDDPQLHALLGTALAYLGRRTEAVREGERGLSMSPISKDAFGGAYVQHQLARIYIMVGEPEKALDQLEPLLKVPYFLSPGWLRVDPTFDPLRSNPRFKKLADRPS